MSDDEDSDHIVDEHDDEGEGDDDKLPHDDMEDGEYDDAYEAEDEGSDFEIDPEEEEEDAEEEEDDEEEEEGDDNDDVDAESTAAAAIAAAGVGEFETGKNGLKVPGSTMHHHKMAPSSMSSLSSSSASSAVAATAAKTRSVRLYAGISPELTMISTAKDVSGPPPPIPSLLPLLDADDLPIDDEEAVENLLRPLNNSVEGGRAFVSVF